MPADVYTLEQAEEDIAVLRGQVDRLTEILTQSDFGSGPNTPAVSGYSMFSSLGHQKYVSGGGSALNTGQLLGWTTGTQSIASASQATITGLSVPVDSGVTYVFHAMVPLIGGSGATNGYVTIGGPTTSLFGATIVWGQSATAAVVRFQTTIGVNTGLNSAGALSNGGNYFVFLAGVATFTASGSLTVAGASTGAVQAYISQPGAILAAYAST